MRTEQRLEATLEAAREADMLHWEALCINLRSQLHAARGSEGAARRDFDTAIEIFEKLESRIELGRSLVLRGGLRTSNAPVGSSKLVA